MALLLDDGTQFETVYAEDYARGAVEAVMPLAEAKGLDVRLGAHPSVAVTADPRRLEQVLVNLLSNAVKFTPPGGWVAVDVDVSERWVEVRVADTGSGIDPECLPHVVDRFRQKGTTARSANGLGLGLFIARQLIEAHGALCGRVRARTNGSVRWQRVSRCTSPNHSSRPSSYMRSRA